MIPAAEFAQLPSVEEQRLKPCAGCGRKLVMCGPTFWLVRPVRAILDQRGLAERVGLSLQIGSAKLASVFAGHPAARKIDTLPEICICERCAMERPLGELALRDQPEEPAT